MALLSQRKGLSAKPHLVRSLALNPAQPQALNYLGMVEQALGNPDSARVLYRRAVELDTSFAQAKTNLASLDPVPSRK